MVMQGPPTPTCFLFWGHQLDAQLPSSFPPPRLVTFHTSNLPPIFYILNPTPKPYPLFFPSLSTNDNGNWNNFLCWKCLECEDHLISMLRWISFPIIFFKFWKKKKKKENTSYFSSSSSFGIHFFLFWQSVFFLLL